jgi:hypothetical protein
MMRSSGREAEALLDALGVVEGFDVVEQGGAELGAGVPRQ